MRTFHWYFVALGKGDVEILLKRNVKSILVSYASFKRGLPDILESARKAGRVRVMLDSGAFTNLSHPGSVTLDNYMAFLREHKDLVDEYVTFDDINSLSKTVANHRRMLEAGFKPMFVDHLRNNPGDAHSEMYKTGEKVAWGNIANLSILSRSGSKKRLLHILKEKADARIPLAEKAPATRVHLLGAGARVAKLAPWLHFVESFDTSSWSMRARRNAELSKSWVGDDGWPRMSSWSIERAPSEWLAEVRKMGYSPSDWKDRCYLAVDQYRKHFRAIEKRYDQGVGKSEDLYALVKRDAEIDGEPESDPRGVVFFDRVMQEVSPVIESMEAAPAEAAPMEKRAKEFGWYFVCSTKEDTDILLDAGARSMLLSFAFFKRGIPERVAAAVKMGKARVMLDSGAFTNLKYPGRIKLADYLAYLDEHKELISEYITLDDLRSPTKTLANYRTMLDKGFKPMFVDHVRHNFHAGLAPIYKSGEKLAWGNIVSLELFRESKNRSKMATMHEKIGQRDDFARASPVTKVHLLGVGSRITKFRPWFDMVDSFDTSSWTAASKWGRIPYITKSDDGWPVLRGYHHSEAPPPGAAQVKDSSDWRTRIEHAVRVYRQYFAAVEKRYHQAQIEDEKFDPIEKEDDTVNLSHEDERTRSYFFVPEQVEEIMKGRLRTLKVPDPDYVMRRFASDKKVGLLSRVPRASMVGEPFLLINERLKAGEPTKAWGKVELERGIPMASGTKAVASLGRKIDTLTAREFNTEEGQVWYHPLKLLERYPEPKTVHGSVPGRRYSGSVGEKDVLAKAMQQALDQLHSTVANRAEIQDAVGTVLERLSKSKGEVAPSGEQVGRTIHLQEVLDTFGDAVVRRGAVTLVGGLVNHGQTDNDIDILVRGPFDEATRSVIQFRVGRMLAAADPEMSDRVQFLDEHLGGPFTDHVEAFDLVLVARDNPEVIQMRSLEKSDDPLMDPAIHGPKPAVLQAHFRGASVHADLRMRVDGHLIGWTLMVQRAGAVPSVKTIKEAQHIAAGLKPEGSRWFKPLRAPASVQAVSKGRVPLEWLGVDAKVIQPGEVGATREHVGVMVSVDRPKWEQGMNKPYFHEYFFSRGKVLSGVLFLRQLVGRGGTNRTQEGETFWTAHLSKDALPSILSRRAVSRGDMPPAGLSWIPESLEKVTPPQYRYWTKRGKQAKEMRDALVTARYFTNDNVKVVDGEFRRIVTKRFVLLEPQIEECPPKRALGECKVVKAAPSKFVLARETFKGQTVVRPGPSLSHWYIMFSDGHGGLHTLRTTRDPTIEGDPVTAVYQHLHDDALASYEGNPKPGEKVSGLLLNDTKDTSADWRIVDSGRLAVVDESEGMFRLSLKGKDLRGVYLAQAEEAGSTIWTIRPDASVAKAVPMKDGVQIWDPKKKVPGADRRSLRPLALFKPMKPSREYFNPEDALKGFASAEVLKAGLVVEPKYNGRVVVCERDASGKVMIFFEDSWRDRSEYFPTLTRATKGLGTSAIVVGELLDYDGNRPLPRRDLARFGTDKVQDDSHVRVHAWDVLYWDGDNFFDRDWRTREKVRAKALHGNGMFRNVPHRIVSSAGDLKRAVAWAARQPASEGAMLKSPLGTYTLGGQTSSDAKIKLIRPIRAIVYGKERKAASEHQTSPSKTFVYDCAVGPLPHEDIDAWQKVVQIDGQSYTRIGKTLATNVAAEKGDTLLVDVTELLLDTVDRKSVTWFTPMVVEKVDAQPMTASQVEAIVRRDEIKKLDGLPWGALHLVKSDSLHYVLGVVLEPNDGKSGNPLKPDTQQDVYSEDEIREAAWRFLAEYRRIGEMHERLVRESGVEVVESYIAPDDFSVGGQHIRKGTWMLGARVLDEDLWAKIKRGEYAAWSVDGTALRKPLAN